MDRESAVGRPVILTFRRRIGAVEDASARARRRLACVREPDIGIPTQREASQPTVVAIEQRPRFVPRWRHPQCERGHLRVEHLVARGVRLQRIEVASRQSLSCHVHLSWAQGASGVTPG